MLLAHRPGPVLAALLHWYQGSYQQQLSHASNVAVYQFEGLTRLAQHIQRVGLCHIHHLGNLLLSTPLDVLLQSRPVYREWRFILPVSRLKYQRFHAFNVPH